MQHICALGVRGAIVAIVLGGQYVAASETSVKQSATGPNRAQWESVQKRAVGFLRASQADDGSWTTPNSPGITGLVVFALLENGVPARDAVVARGLKQLESFVHDDGGIYDARSGHRNYETCIGLLAFHAANGDGRYKPLIAAAEKFLRKLQWDEGEGLESSDAKFGGAGYGRSERPDLSNTQFLVEALKAAGADANDEAVQKAIVFVSRCQNLETEHNTTPAAAKVNDGGFYYTAAAGGQSPAGNTPNGGLRSYGAMTYAGLKSMVYAGLTQDDPRVKAASNWIRQYYTVTENPGMGQQGLYYYYHTFAKTLAVMKVGLMEDAAGRKHNWRTELTAQLAKLQQPNGSWVNSTDRWFEGDPNLATAFALMALKYCGPNE